MSSAQRNPGYKESPDVAVLRLASSQHGLVTYAQAVDLGLSKFAMHRRAASGEWLPIMSGVYRMASAPLTWRQRLLAGCLWIGLTAVASHRSAAALLELDGFDEEIVELTTTKRVRALPEMVIHVTNSLPPYDVGSIERIPLTAPARTLFDLGAVASKDVVELALEDALRRQLVTLTRLRWELQKAGGRGRRGGRVLGELLADRPAAYRPTESTLEVELLRLIREARLPLPELSTKSAI